MEKKENKNIENAKLAIAIARENLNKAHALIIDDRGLSLDDKLKISHSRAEAAGHISSIILLLSNKGPN